MNESPQTRPLSFDRTYHCPACRQGNLATMPLMDAFACSFCRHIFTANLDQQAISMADSPVPLLWYWTGQAWKSRSQVDTRWGWIYGVAIVAFILLPTAIVGCGAYYFPPLPGSRLAWLPSVWVGLTFTAHLTCISWLLLAYYQFSPAIYLQATRNRLLGASNASDASR